MEERDIITVQEMGYDESSDGKIRYAVCSEVGDRENQQDSVYVGENSNEFLAILCDGMGGLKGGEIASTLAVNMFKKSFSERKDEPVPDYLHRLAVEADIAVNRLESNGKPMGAGSTVVAVLSCAEGIYWLSVGDSKIYICRGEEMLCPFQPHNYRTVLNQKLTAGSISKQTYEKEVVRGAGLVSYLGMGGLNMIDINNKAFQILTGDQLLLCSDGLYKSVTENEIKAVLASGASPREKTWNLVDKALVNGSPRQDNTSVILLTFPVMDNFVTCPNGHMYDANKYSDCPYCQPEMQEETMNISE